MSDHILLLSRQTELAHHLLQHFQGHKALRFYPSLAGPQELHSLLQHLNPQVILVGPDIPEAADAAALREVLSAAHSPPLIFLQAAQDPARHRFWQAALDWGALETIALSESNWTQSLMQALEALLPLGRESRRQRQSAALKAAEARRLTPGPCRLLLIGASTGGPQALAQILAELPASFALPIVIVQHLPGGFTDSLARQLQSLSALQVREALPQDRLQAGQALIVPGNQQVRLMRNGQLALYRAEGHIRPSVDLALISAVQAFHREVLALILTGMGQDGLAGVQRLKAVGGRCLAEHPSSCVVYGMPRAVIEAGLADRVLPLPRIAAELKRWGQPQPPPESHGGSVLY
jgi:two-component system chemotaxis response regulator CheB